MNTKVCGGSVVTTTTANEMKELVESFNEMMKEKARADFNSTIETIEDFLIEHGEEVGCMIGERFEYKYDYEDLWQNWVCGKKKVEPSAAIDYYRINSKKFINEEDMSKYLDELAKEHHVVIDDDDNGERWIYMKNPYSGGFRERVLDIAKVVGDQWEANAIDNYVKLDWSLFEERDKELMLSNKEIAEKVYDWLLFIHRGLFSECHACDDCFYVRLNKDIDSLRKQQEEVSGDFLEFLDGEDC